MVYGRRVYETVVPFWKTVAREGVPPGSPLAGGALAGELATAGLLDEILLLVGPVLLGSGRPLLALEGPLPARLREAHPRPLHCTVLRYEVVEAFPELG